MFHSAHPKRHHGQRKSLGPLDVLEQIQTYLKAAENQPHFHADAIYSERHGPTYAGISSEGGLALQQLRRIEAGIRGEILAIELAPPELSVLDALNDAHSGASTHPSLGTGSGSKDENAAQTPQGLNMRQAGELPFDKTGNLSPAHGVDDLRDWNDKSYNEQMLDQGEVGITEGEIGKRSNIIDQEVPYPARKRTLEEALQYKSSVPDKELRKRAKKDRRKTEQKAKEKQRQEGGEK